MGRVFTFSRGGKIFFFGGKLSSEAQNGPCGVRGMECLNFGSDVLHNVCSKAAAMRHPASVLKALQILAGVPGNLIAVALQDGL